MKKKAKEEVFDPDKFTSKEEYIRMLRRDRDIDEKEKELSKETIEDIEKRKRREYEVEIA